MIEMIRDDAMSINMVFDEDGNKELLKAFNKILNSTVSYEMAVCFDAAILTLKKHTLETIMITIQKDNKVDGSIIMMLEDSIVWKLDEEYIDMGIEFFRRSMQKGYFWPAEFIRVEILKNKKNLDYMYCKRI